MANLEIIISENVSQKLDELAAFASDMSRPNAEIASYLATQTRINFKNQSSPLGVPWKPSKRAVAEGGLTLLDRGDLFGSIKADWGKDYAAAGPEASGGAAIYAAIHQWGGKIKAKAGRALKTPFGAFGSVTIPARPYLGWNETMEARAVSILSAHISAVFGGPAPTTGAA